MVSEQIEKIEAIVAIAEVKKYLLDLQNCICQMLEQEEGDKRFIQDPWQYPQGGGGITRVLTDGVVFEKAGVNFSHVKGLQLPLAATNKRPELANASFQALGVSVVVHPRNPYVPTSHFNVRFILVEKPNQSPIWWFGGGFDLTPYYGFIEDAIYWHETAKDACNILDEFAYRQYKQWADEYFFLKHRQEARGIGGIFFDDVNAHGFDKCFAFMQSVGEHYIKAYQPIVAKRKQHTYGEKERQFQLYRRGRYVEFNLLYDRGTLFGIQSNGRTESILMSLPPLVSWVYDWRAEAGSAESTLYEQFLPIRDWISVRKE